VVSAEQHLTAKVTALRKSGHPAQAHAVSQLRRPSAPLWATNQLAHEDRKRLAEFIDSVEGVRRTQLRDPRASLAFRERVKEPRE